MSSSSCHRTCLLGSPMPPCPRRIAQSGKASTGRTGQPKIARRESRHPPELHFSRAWGSSDCREGERHVFQSALFRFVSTSRPTTLAHLATGRGQKPKVTARPRVSARIPRAREPCGPLTPNGGAEQDCCCTARETCFPGLAGGLFPIRATAMNSRMGVWIGWVTRQSNDRIFEQWQEEGRARQVIIRAGDFQQWVANRRVSCSVGDKSPVVG